MSFAPAWLDLREPVDHAARDAGLLAQAVQVAGPAPVIVDLASGTGSTLRAFAPVLGGVAAWRLVDHDARLLGIAAARAGGSATIHRMDLNDLDALPLAGASLVSASALLDLCARDWVQALVATLARHRLPFYAALSYDGQMVWTPADPADDAVTAAFNRDQRRDKGFGTALGPDAASVTADLLRAAGYQVTLASSPWRLGPDHADLQRDFLDGVAQAAQDAGAPDAPDWAARRHAAIAHATCHVGHLDLLALPPETP